MTVLPCCRAFSRRGPHFYCSTMSGILKWLLFTPVCLKSHNLKAKKKEYYVSSFHFYRLMPYDYLTHLGRVRPKGELFVFVFLCLSSVKEKNVVGL